MIFEYLNILRIQLSEPLEKFSTMLLKYKYFNRVIKIDFDFLTADLPDNN